MREAIAKAASPQTSRGVILQSTRAGLRLYERMGFRAVTSVHVFLSR